MKRIIYSTIVCFLVLIFLSSCSTTNDVVSGSSIVKRKYTKGYYVDAFQLFNQQAQGSVVLSKQEIIKNKDGSNDEFQLTASVDSSILLADNISSTDFKSASKLSATLKSVKHLYDSDITDLTAFRTEYKKIKKDLRSSFVLPVKGGEDSRYSLSILSFISALVGVFVAGIVLGTLAIILGAIALVKKKKGRALAILGILFGIIDIFLVLRYLSAL